MNNHKIQTVDNTRFFGLRIDEHCHWKNNIEKLCSKLSSFVYLLRKLVRISGRETAIAAYYGHVYSIIRFGIIFWGNSTDKNDVFKMQKRCIRALVEIKPWESCRPYFHKLQLLPVPCIYILECLIFVKKHYKLFHEKTLEDYTIRLRRKYDLIFPTPKCALYRKSVFYMCILLFNKLPDNIKKMNFIEFKKIVTKILKQKCYYDVADYLNDTLDLF